MFFLLIVAIGIYSQFKWEHENLQPDLQIESNLD